tara:strand:+ start:246 stop:392 length:147 start_codon:yes stop_codon:yes gene_type:complete
MEDQFIDEIELMSQTIELLVDQLHKLTEDGRYLDAEAVAKRIRELQEI